MWVYLVSLFYFSAELVSVSGETLRGVTLCET